MPKVLTNISVKPISFSHFLVCVAHFKISVFTRNMIVDTGLLNLISTMPPLALVYGALVVASWAIICWVWWLHSDQGWLKVVTVIFGFVGARTLFCILVPSMFVLISSPVVYKKDPSVETPMDSAATISADVKDRFVVTITGDGSLEHEGEVITLEEFKTRLSKSAKQKVLLRASSKVPYGKIKEVSRAAAEVGRANIRFVTKE